MLDVWILDPKIIKALDDRTREIQVTEAVLNHYMGKLFGEKMMFEVKDSGKREEFSTGARRDVRTGKGRFDLLSWIAIQRLAIILEKGALKYGDRNWEKGMPLTRYLDSAIRHTSQVLQGKLDEDHAAQAMFNLMAFIHTKQLIDDGKLPSELDDIDWEETNDQPYRSCDATAHAAHLDAFLSCQTE